MGGVRGGKDAVAQKETNNTPLKLAERMVRQEGLRTHRPSLCSMNITLFGYSILFV